MKISWSDSLALLFFQIIGYSCFSCFVFCKFSDLSIFFVVKFFSVVGLGPVFCVFV